MKERFGVFVAIALFAQAVCPILCAAPHVPRHEDFSHFAITGLSSGRVAHMKRTIRELLGDGDISAGVLENVLWTIFRELERDGFAKSYVRMMLLDRERNVFHRTYDTNSHVEIPDNFSPVIVRICVMPGRQNYLQWLRIKGIDAIPLREQRQIFYTDKGLHVFRKERFYTPQRVQMGILKLRQRLYDEGYRFAEFLDQDVEHLGNRYGIQLNWDQGRPCLIREITVELQIPDNTPAGRNAFLDAVEKTATCPAGVLATAEWIDEQVQFFRNLFYEAGYAEARFDYELQSMATLETEQQMRLVVKVEPGMPSIVGEIFLEPVAHFDRPFYRRRLAVTTGDFLNPDDVITSRSRLQSLGVFNSVEIKYGPRDVNGVQNIHFIGKQKGHNEVFFRIGAGDYDLLRVGIDWEQRNLWHRAHSGRLQAIRSAKRTNFSYDYEIPEAPNPQTSLFFSGEYSHRDGYTLNRKDRSVAFGLERSLFENSHGIMQYGWSSMAASSSGSSAGYGKTRGCAGSFLFAFERNGLDNPLVPTRGYRYSIELEAAAPFFGGNSEYERLECEWARHHRMGEISFLRLAIRHGVIHSFGNPVHRIPLSKRFLNGGPNSMRGFQEGQASPIDETGQSLGAASYTLVNLEWEQNLFNRLSYFVFLDVIGMCRDMHNYPFNAFLASIGPGIAHQTFIGPLRITYAWNCKRRPQDPVHRFRFSVGFPF
ncbi:MAG: BamA/TamA family outer membrane protein [Puniceicoccales bacterium]|jgi:outer membrane protein assembly factor BamA|nr:BamA/TamA family outer membrane protein [Puniceicoccales bacterium]